LALHCFWPAASGIVRAFSTDRLTLSLRAMLFLAAGSVIHAMGGEQDMLKWAASAKK